jgi:hypothetical protein
MDGIKKHWTQHYNEHKFKYLTVAALAALSYHEYWTRRLAVAAVESSNFLLEKYIDKE